MRENPSSFPGDGFFDEEGKMTFLPDFECLWKNIWIGQYSIRHYPNEVFSSFGFRVSRNIVENLSLNVDKATLNNRLRINLPDRCKDSRSAIDNESGNTVLE